MKAIDKLIEWLDEKKYKADIVDVILKARELRDAEQKEPPYDREAFRRELIVALASNPQIEVSQIFLNADAIIAEYERRQNEQR